MLNLEGHIPMRWRERTSVGRMPGGGGGSAHVRHEESLASRNMSTFVVVKFFVCRDTKLAKRKQVSVGVLSVTPPPNQNGVAVLPHVRIAVVP
jgi:hypothetical protein